MEIWLSCVGLMFSHVDQARKAARIHLELVLSCSPNHSDPQNSKVMLLLDRNFAFSHAISEFPDSLAVAAQFLVYVWKI